MNLLFYTGGGLCDSWKPKFLLCFIFDWRTFSRRVTGRWRRQWVKNQGLTNQNLRNRWCLIVRRIIRKIKCWPIRTREIAGVSLSDVLYGGRGVTRYFFSSKDKDPWLRLTTLSLKCYTFYFKGSYGSKTVCCCGTTLQKKRLKDATSIAEGITRSNVNYLCKWKSEYLHDL